MRGWKGFAEEIDSNEIVGNRFNLEKGTEGRPWGGGFLCKRSAQQHESNVCVWHYESLHNFFKDAKNRHSGQKLNYGRENCPTLEIQEGAKGVQGRRLPEKSQTCETNLRQIDVFLSDC